MAEAGRAASPSSTPALRQVNPIILNLGRAGSSQVKSGSSQLEAVPGFQHHIPRSGFTRGEDLGDYRAGEQIGQPTLV